MRLLKNRAALNLEPKEVKESSYDLIVKQRNFQRDMYIDFLKKLLMNL